MVGHQVRQELIAQGEVVAGPIERACTDQTFEIPGGVYVTMAVMFVGFVTVLAMVLRGGHLVVAFGAIFAFIAAYFTVPWMFPRTAGKKALSWDDFSNRGLMTATGHVSARETTILVLLLPTLVFCFGLAVAILWTLS